MSDKLGTFARFFICKIEFAVRETQEQKSLILLLSAEAFILHQRRIVHAHCNTIATPFVCSTFHAVTESLLRKVAIMYHNTNTIYNEICQPKREKKEMCRQHTRC